MKAVGCKSLSLLISTALSCGYFPMCIEHTFDMGQSKQYWYVLTHCKYCSIEQYHSSAIDSIIASFQLCILRHKLDANHGPSPAMTLMIGRPFSTFLRSKALADSSIFLNLKICHLKHIRTKAPQVIIVSNIFTDALMSRLLHPVWREQWLSYQTQPLSLLWACWASLHIWCLVVFAFLGQGCHLLRTFHRL